MSKPKFTDQELLHWIDVQLFELERELALLDLYGEARDPGDPAAHAQFDTPEFRRRRRMLQVVREKLVAKLAA